MDTKICSLFIILLLSDISGSVCILCVRMLFDCAIFTLIRKKTIDENDSYIVHVTVCERKHI